jgi:hypothetical protein
VNLYRLLVRHFFQRFFDAESLSPQGEPEAGLFQTLGILAAPGAIAGIVVMPLSAVGWTSVSMRLLFVLFSMIVMAFVVIFEWDALFPDRRDYQVLTPIPIPLRTLFFAKAIALALFLALFLADVNFFSTLLWPGIDSGRSATAMWGAHITVVFASGWFAALAAASLQGILITVFSGRVYRIVSTTLQTLLMALLVMLFFLSPMIAFYIERLYTQHSVLLYWFPGYWFAGLYEQLRPAVRGSGLAALGSWAIRGLVAVTALFLVTFLAGYRRHTRRVLESESDAAGARSGIRLAFLRDPVEAAVFHFISQSITRSVKHRLFLATYGGFGAALAVLSLASGPEGRLRLPLTLSFVLVSGLRAAFNYPSELRANWSFQLAEVTRPSHYVLATRKWVVAYAILPLFVLLSPMEFASFPPWTAALHSAYGIALSVLLMEVIFFDFRKAPFTCAHFPGKVNLTFLAVIYVFGFTLYSRTMAALEQWLSLSVWRVLLFFALAALAMAALIRLRDRRLTLTPALIYDDAADPVVRTLGLSSE